MRPKITITKMFLRGNQGHYRFYNPSFNPANPRAKRPAFTYDLEGDSNYPFLNIQTEKQLAWFIFKTFGPGIYRVISNLRGWHGAYTFWKGEVTAEGFTFLKREKNESSELHMLTKELNQAESEEEKEQIRSEMELEKTIMKQAPTRYGFRPFLRPSSFRGEFVTWEEPDNHYYKEPEEAQTQAKEW